jgi:hypothetical protein
VEKRDTGTFQAGHSISIFTEQFGAAAGEGHEGQFIDDEQFVAGDLILDPGGGSVYLN